MNRGDRPVTLDQLIDQLESVHQEIHDSLQDGADRMNGFQTDIEQIAKTQSEIRQGVAELLDIWKAGKGWIRVWGWILVGLKWLVGFGVAIGAIIYFIKTGHWPSSE